MKYLRLAFLCLVCCAISAAQTALAQTNVLRVDTVKAPSGAALSLNVVLENQSDVTGVQFDIAVPYELAKDGGDVVIAEAASARIPNHAIAVNQLSNADKSYYPNGPDQGSANMSYKRYRIIVYSAKNELVVDDRGTLLTLQLTTDLALKSNALLPVYVENVTLSDPQEQEVAVTTKNGAIIIENIPRPDLEVSGVTFTPNAVSPGGQMTVSWVVKNIGDEATGAGWTEQISLVSLSGTTVKTVATTYYDQVLTKGGQVSRQVVVDLPDYLGLDGICKVQVEVVPTDKTGEHPSMRANNIAQASANIEVTKQLTLELSKTRFTEGGTQRVQAKLNRSGSWTLSQTFQIALNPNDSRVDIVKNVNIPAGQSGVVFYFNVLDNDVVDADSVVNITVSGTGYQPATERIVIEDNEYAALSVTASQSVLTEGDTFTLTVSAPKAVSEDTQVRIVSEDNKRFLFNSTAVIPAGQQSVTVEVRTLDDELPHLEQSNKFTVSAQRFSIGEVIVVLQDNDIPALTLTLTPNQVSEGAGPTSVSAVLTRTGVTDNKITIKLSDDSNGGLYYSNKTIVMDKGVETVVFNLGPVDNTLQDGDRTYTLTAAIWVSSCSCAASTGQSAGYVESQLTVLDNDGAALSVKSQVATIKEGDETTITVSRNTLDMSQPLTVTLSSNYDADMEYQKNVTIPAGQQSVNVTVKSKKNEVNGDTQTVIFTVSATGYASGTCVLMVTDQTLPDARIVAIETSVQEALVMSKFDISVTLQNDGAYELPANTPISIYWMGLSKPSTTFYTEDPLPAGSSMVITRSHTMYSLVGDHVLYAVVNPNKQISELVYTNNTSAEITLKALSPFTVQVQTDRQLYRQGEKVRITGQVSGENAGDTRIDVYMINDGARVVQSTRTDAEGKFTYEWQLYSMQSGHFSVGACYRDDPTTEEMAAFDVYGLKRVDDSYITCDVTCGEPYTGVVRLVNAGTLPLTGVTTELVGAPEGCDAQFDIKSEIGSKEEVSLAYSFTGSQPTQGNKWEMVKVRITSAEGAFYEVSFHYFARLAKANLVASVKNLVTTMNKDTGRDYTFKVSNIGKGNSGKLSLSLPDWMMPLTGRTMPALNQGDTATIVLRMMPTEDMQLNVPVTGRFGINCENGNGTFVNFNVTPVSDVTGTLLIDVCDEYTYYTEEKPHVKDAEVVLRNPVTGALVAQGTTDADGHWSMVLPEGYYQVNVTADNHDSYRNNILVDPGVTTTEVVNLSYQAVSVSWSVEETEVEDEYNIVTTVKYETNVPMPVVETVVPDKIEVDKLAEGESIVFYAVLTNKGLITAQKTSFTIAPEAGGCSWTPLVEHENLTLAPQQSYTIPVQVTKLPEASGSRFRASGNSGCATQTGTDYYWECGKDGKWHKYPCTITYSVCTGEAGGVQGAGGGPADPITDGSDALFEYSSSGAKLSGSSNNSCSPCLTHLDNAIADVIDCGLGIAGIFSPTAGVIGGIWSTIRTAQCFSQAKNDFGANVICTIGAIGTILGTVGGTMGATVSAGIACGFAEADILNGCGAPSAPSRQYGRKGVYYESASEPLWMLLYRDRMMYAREYLKAKMEYLDVFFGDEVWKERMTTTELQDLASAVSIAVSSGTVDADALRVYKPMDISNEQFDLFIERINNSIDEESTADNRINFTRLEQLEKGMERLDKTAQEMKQGFTGIANMVAREFASLQQHVKEDRSSVCSTISLQIDQTMTMTRQAFRGTLTIGNGGKAPMTDIKLKLNVVNKQTNLPATAREFEMHTESLKMFEGDLDMESGWYLGADSTGTATILFIPSKYAAPDEPIDYSFGGTLYYVDPYTGLEVTRELYPVTLTVKPSPELDLTYFMQRDLYGDDPLTEEIEPVVPGEFAVIINNKGNGDATNVRMVTKQPQIIENEKGAFINFEFVSSQLNGQEKTLAMGETIPTEFGNIPAHTQAYAQWWLESSLLGHFVDYDIQATHVSSYGNENLSLLDQVTIHELIHGLTPPAGSVSDGSAVGRAFLVNDIADGEEQPDRLYFTDGSEADVAVAAAATIEKLSNTEYMLTVYPTTAGWNYGSLLDPTVGRRNLLSIVRLSDNVELPVDNMWQTDRKLIDGKEWRYVNHLHFIDQFDASSLVDGIQYKLTFEDRADVVLEVESITGMELNGQLVRTDYVDKVKVTFNKAIQPETFTADDVKLNVQGEPQDLSTVGFASEDNKVWTLDFTELNRTLPNGYYVLTVQTSEIKDYEGYNGYTGKKADWVLFLGGLVPVTTTEYPLYSGTILREKISGEASDSRMANYPLSTIHYPLSAPSDGNVTSVQYGDKWRFTATANEGFEFVNWTLGGVVISTNPVYETTVNGELDLVANFKKLQYRLVLGDAENGTLGGNGTGFYDHGTEVEIVAEPDEDFALKEWIVNDVVQPAVGDTLRLTITAATTVQPVFVRDIYTQTITLAYGWNWMSTYLLEQQSLDDMSRYVNRMLDQQNELIRDSEFGLVGGINYIEPNKGYKVDASTIFSITMRGHIQGVDAAALNLLQGWNWMAYPYFETKNIADVLTNAEAGDYLVSQTGFSSYDGSSWEGNVSELTPGKGYLYKSASTKQLQFDFTEAAGSRMANYPLSTIHHPLSSAVDPHRYPSTMNITARIYRDGVELPGSQYTVYAYAGDELRGVSQFVGSNHYLTVYGDEPVNISFIVESAETGETFAAAETLTFVSDVVGSRKNPYAVSISTTTGISQQMADTPMSIYTLDGILVSRDATIKTLQTLPKGVYIVNGRKTAVK